MDNVVYYEGNPALRLNKNLILRQGLTEGEVEKIKELHVCRLILEWEIATNKDADFESLIRDWHEVQFKLQEAWKFPLDKNYHRFWDIPTCKCPKMDNDDAYPTGYYVYSADCPLHGPIMHETMVIK